MDSSIRSSVIIIGAGISGEFRHHNDSLTTTIHLSLYFSTTTAAVSQLNSHQRVSQLLVLLSFLFWFQFEGISAAKVLAENGVEDIIILEASDRIGGRIRKECFGGVSVELGAGWIAGVGGREANPVWELAVEHNIRTCFSDYSNARYNIYDQRSTKSITFIFSVNFLIFFFG